MAKRQSAASKGGHQRAIALSDERRRQIAAQAAKARWSDASIPKATHGDEDHPLRIGEIDIPCYVLDNDMRVITHRGLQRALGRPASGGAQLTADFIRQFDGKGIDCKDLIARISSPIIFRPTKGGRTAYGYDAAILADFCKLFLKARQLGLLSKRHEAIAARCEILLSGFAHTGIIALIDEATGYQYDRSRRALEAILDAFIQDQLGRWAKRFPDEFYRELLRLLGLKFMPFPTSRRPRIIGKLTRDIVYERMAPGILQDLEKRNPPGENGRRRHKHHQWLTTDIGHPRLQEHIASVITLMKISDDFKVFKKHLDKALPKYTKTPLFDDQE